MDNLTDPRRLLDALMRNQFLAFTMKSFQLLLTGEDNRFQMGNHIEAMCHAVEECLDGKYNRLIIEVPPRHGKSIFVSTALPAFVLGRDPSAKILVASYGAELAEEHTRNTRKIMLSEDYKRLFPGTLLTRDRAGEFTTTQGGVRRAVSVGGATTGFGADIIIVDDLIKADAAHSEAEIARVEEYLSSSLITRLNNQKTGKIIVIQQRLSELDPAGYLREKGGFHILSLPAIAQQHEVIPLTGGKTWTRKPGDLLFPQRYSLETLNRIEKDMGKARFSAQYLQNPTPVGGNRLNREWFKSYSFEPSREMYQSVVQSWDTGQSEEPTSGFSVCTTWGLRDGKWHLLDVFRERLAVYQLFKMAKSLHKEWRADKIVIEKAASGYSLLEHLRSPEVGLRDTARAYTPKLGKEERFEEAIAQIEDGRFALPNEAPWLDTFIRECLAFPKTRHDDQVDSLSQFILWQKSSLGRAAYTRSQGAVQPKARRRGERLTDEYLARCAAEDAKNYAIRDKMLQR